MIDETTVKKLAELARLEVSQDEALALTKDLEQILGYVSELNKVAATASESELPAWRNVLRPDGESEPSEAHTEALLKEMVATKDGYLVVKKILNNG